MSTETLHDLFSFRLPDYHLVSAEPLSGGLSNRCWKVVLTHKATGERHTLVWRPHSFSSQAFGVSRQHEFQVLQSTLKTSCFTLAPKPFALFNEGLLVDWVVGQTASIEFSLTTLMSLQVAIHQQPLPSWRLNPQHRGAHYWRYMGDATGDPQLERIHAFFQAQPVKKWFEETCCHHDLGWYNIIVAPDDRHTVIDWEYAAAGDPSLDLALTIAANQLEPSEAVDIYCQQVGVHDAVAQSRWHSAVEYWHPWCDYLAMLWFYVGANQFACGEGLDEDYLREAESLKALLWNNLQFSD